MRISARLPLPAAALLLLAWSLTGSVFGQCVSLTAVGTPSTQNFDTLATTGTNIVWADNSTLAGWYSTRTTYNAGTGSSTTGALYSFGVAATNPLTERALGGVGSGGTGTFYWAVCFVNNTGTTLTALDLSYVGEQWRDGLPVPAAAHTLAFEYQVAAPGTITDANTPVTGWTAFSSLDFTGPRTGTSAGALDGNLPANRTAKSASLTTSVAPGNEAWLRWRDINDASNDHGLAVDDFSVTPQGVVAPTPSLSLNDVALDEGNAGTTSFTFTVSLSSPALVGGVTFDIATADGTAAQPGDYASNSLVGQSIAEGNSTFSFTVLVNGDTTPETNETFFVNVSNVVGATVGDAQGLGTIGNDDIALSFVHDLQGSGSATPIPPATVVRVEGVATADFQAASQLRGFFLQEEDADVDADPLSSEGIFVFCNSCPTAVAEGQRVQVIGTVAEFFGATELTASTAGSVLVTEPGNHLAEVTPSPLDLPVVGVVNDFYEAREGMRVTFVDALFVAEYFELARFGHIELFEGGRPRQFTESAPPSVAGYSAHLAALDRRRVILDDDDNAQNVSLLDPDGSQFIFPPRANGGFSIGTQGTDFFRGGDLVTGLTGVLDWSFAGVSGTDAWRIRPTAATPAAFTVANPRPATPPAVGGAIRAVGMNLLNYFTTIDTTASSSSGPCGPAFDQDCRGADNLAELDRQRERASIVICALDADVYGFGELENTTPSATITDLLGAVNTRCGGANPYAIANTGATLGTDAIRVQIVYRSGILAPVGAPLVDLDPIHNRPPTAQTFDVVDPLNPAFGERFTVIANHFKSKGCSGATGGDADSGDGQGCYAARRTAQASRLLTWIGGTVLPAAGDPDMLLLGDFNSYAQETPVTTLTGGGFVDVATALLGGNAYSYLFDAQLGHLDYAFASASLFSQVTGVESWHINADEANLFDYNDEVKDVGEAAFEEKPDGSALVPPRVLFQPASPYRASDHDPVLIGIFQLADLVVAKVDTPDPVVAGTNLVYTITVTNNGPDAAAAVAVDDTLPAGTTFVGLAFPGGWSCTPPPVGSGGTLSCSSPSLAVGSATFTLTVQVASSIAGGSVLSNTASASSTTADPAPGDESATATSTVLSPAGVSATKSVATAGTPGSPVTYTVVLTNAGPAGQGDNPGAEFTDTLPAELELVGATASTGTVATDTVNGVVTWDGSIPAGGTVTIVIDATLPFGVTAGTTIANQGLIAFDADGNGTNESNALTDDPGAGGAADPTTFVVGATVSVVEIPALGGRGFAALALTLAGMALLRLRRFRRPS